MIVGRSSFEAVISALKSETELALDTETTGLRPHHGDRLFSIIIASERETYYFNFQAYANLEPDLVLSGIHLDRLRVLFHDSSKLWYMHNAKFDMAMLSQEGLEITGTIHCCLAIARVEYNDHRNYDLDSCLERIGKKKDSRVEEYIEAHKLWTEKEIPGINREEKIKHYDCVPFELITEYGQTDVRGTFELGRHQICSLQRSKCDLQSTRRGTVWTVCENERALIHSVYRMEHLGVRIDRAYTMRAARFENDRSVQATVVYKNLTGRDYKASPKDFAEIFIGERDLWDFTEKGNPSFSSEILVKFTHPAAKIILEIRDAKSKADFYNGFLYHQDTSGDVHPNYNPHGTAHGRFSSSNPNFQNLTAEDILLCRSCKVGYDFCAGICPCGSKDFETIPFVTRRAIVPRPGFVFIMVDFDQMEYRMMFDVATDLLANQTKRDYPTGWEKVLYDNYGIDSHGSKIIREIKAGKDPHQATADLVTSLGSPLTRGRAKNGNFALLYGSGDKKLAETIGSSKAEAQALRRSIFDVSPELKFFLQAVIGTAEKRGYINNWYGRICHFPNSQLSYRATNYLIAGGCADVVKIAMNTIHEYLKDRKSRMVMSIHDELVIECHESELASVPITVKNIMESVYPYKYLPLTCGIEWSDISLADKRKGFPV